MNSGFTYNEWFGMVFARSCMLMLSKQRSCKCSSGRFVQIYLGTIYAQIYIHTYVHVYTYICDTDSLWISPDRFDPHVWQALVHRTVMPDVGGFCNVCLFELPIERNTFDIDGCDLYKNDDCKYLIESNTRVCIWSFSQWNRLHMYVHIIYT